MFLITLNGNQQRLVSTFSKLVKQLSWPLDRQYVVSLVAADQAIVYNLILTHIQETVSKKNYFSGFVIKNPKGEKYYRSDLFSPLFLGDCYPEYKGKKYDVSHLFPTANNGYIPTDADVPETILDQYDLLKPILDKYFNPESVAPTGPTGPTDSGPVPATAPAAVPLHS